MSKIKREKGSGTVVCLFCCLLLLNAGGASILTGRFCPVDLRGPKKGVLSGN